MSNLDAFWAEIDDQLQQLTTARTVDDVLRICPERSSGDGFFAGGGGDETVIDALTAAGWTTVWHEAWYFWCAQSPTGDLLTYVEGDLYRGNQHPSKNR